jgi:hypothetical protein
MPQQYYDQVKNQGYLLGFNPFMYKHMTRRTPGSEIEQMSDISPEFTRQLKTKNPDWSLGSHLQGIYDKYPDDSFNPINYSHRRFNPYSVMNMESTSMGNENYPNHRSNWYIPKKKIQTLFPGSQPMDYNELEHGMREKYPNIF